MKKFKKIVLITLFISVVFNSLAYLIYWLFNPELTQMQVFLKFWYWTVINIGFSVGFLRSDLD